MAKWTIADIPDQTGRVAVITGANTGLGYETALALAAKGAHVVLAVRNLDKGKDAAALILKHSPNADVALQELDLTSLDSIRAAAEQLRSDSRAHRPTDQQRRGDVHAEVDTPRTASRCSSAPTTSATSPSPAYCWIGSCRSPDRVL